MALNLTAFLGELRHKGTHPHNRFTVSIQSPKILSLPTRQLSLRAATALFPGHTLMTKEDVSRYGYGTVDKTAHNSIYSTVPVGFIVDSQYDIGRVFHQWLQAINNGDQTQSDSTRYRVAYKDDYATEITIKQYNARNNQTVTCVLHEAFPSQIQPTQLGWDQNDQVTILPVNFEYTSHTLS